MQMPGAIASAAFRPASHDARMSAVDHLEELRARLIVSLLALGVAFGLCFWQPRQGRQGAVGDAAGRPSGHAVLACCAIAAVLPGDAITMLLETLPLYILFELSVLIAAYSERRARKRALADAATGESGSGL